jgi:hypothetical protein
MTTISETATGARNHPHAGIWHRTTHALGKLGAKMIRLLSASAAGLDVPPEAWRFPPF